MIQTPTTHDAGCGCDECTTGKRNRFFRGKNMRAGEFQMEQTYAIERRRLINRAIAGWGVVYGYSVKQDDPPDPKKFVVGAGLALDRHGRELDLATATVIAARNTFLLGGGSGTPRVLGLSGIERNRDYLLRVHYAERRFGDAPSIDDCGCDPPEKNFTCETVVFSLSLLPHGRCPCEGCRCRRKCNCPSEPPRHHDTPDDARQEPAEDALDEWLREMQADARQRRGRPDGASDDEAVRPPHGRSCASCGRGPHACLCEWITYTAPPENAGPLCEWKEAGVWIDPSDGVPLACVRVWTTDDECHPIGIEATNACDPRRLVKNNDLLYDLIRGCDLTHISDVSWRKWHRSGDLVEWKHFADMFEPDAANPKRPVRTRFVIHFSSPVLVETVQRRDAVVMTVITIEQNSAWRIARRVPIVIIDTSATREDMPKHLTDRIRLYVDYGWYRDEVAPDAESWLTRSGFTVEIEVRCDFILDCHEQQVDGNPIGLSATPTGNGTPGGTFLSSFWVKPKTDTYRWHDTENA